MADDDMAAALEYVQARMKTVSVDWFQNTGLPVRPASGREISGEQ